MFNCKEKPRFSSFGDQELEKVDATEKVRRQFFFLRSETTLWKTRGKTSMQSDNFSWWKFCLKKKKRLAHDFVHVLR